MIENIELLDPIEHKRERERELRNKEWKRKSSIHTCWNRRLYGYRFDSAVVLVVCCIRLVSWFCACCISCWSISRPTICAGWKCSAT